MENYVWYSQLIKPSWAPSSWLFGPVWTVLYIIILISFGTIFVKVLKKKIPFNVSVPFVLNLVFNFLFTPLQFGLRNNLLATLDILLVLGTLLWALNIIKKHLKWVSVVNLPYLAWVCFATVLQITITILNL